MAISPTQKPDDNAGGGAVSGTNASNAFSGTRAHDGDNTSMEGQYPPGGWGNAIFGGSMPTGTGAPGTQGANPGGPSDVTNEPGQVSDGFTGLPDSAVTDTGAPGASTTPNTSGGGTAISFTNPGSPYGGTYQSTAVQDDLDGSRDSTQANDEGYASGGPQIPGLAGNEPRAGVGRFQPQGGKVLRGGRDVKP